MATESQPDHTSGLGRVLSCTNVVPQGFGIYRPTVKTEDAMFYAPDLGVQRSGLLAATE